MRRIWLGVFAMSFVLAACSSSDGTPTVVSGTPTVVSTNGPLSLDDILTQSAQPLPTGQALDGNAPGIPVLNGDIQTTPSGLRYIDEKVGDGASPTLQNQVIVKYTGWLSSGKIFDSSSDRGPSETLSLNAVIKAWQEGLPTMKVGGKRRLIAPPALAYGAAGLLPYVPPDATVIFDVELLDVK
jgi:hypothetical protein